METFEDRIAGLKENIQKTGGLLVSYSGGVDSTVLAVVAGEVLGERMSCAIVDSPLIPRSELEGAIRLAEELSLSCIVLKSSIMDDPEFLANRKDRCYTCKKVMVRLLRIEAERLGLNNIADGSNTSDLSTYRPGFAALEEAGFIHPFIEAGMNKEDIRRLARVYSLPVSEKPSSSCLASRIPYGTSLDEAALGIIEASEYLIRSTGAAQVRVRKHGDIARIEVYAEDFSIILKNREAISAFLKTEGFRYVTLDIDGFMSGSMD